MEGGDHVKNTVLMNNLRALRFKNGEMTQEEIAQKGNVSRQTIIAIEKGKYNPSVKLALELAKVFSVSVEELFYLEEDK